jgi:hypothetical protein
MSKFEQPGSYEHEDVLAALKRDEPEVLQRLVVGVALNDEDYDFADQVCVRLARHKDPTVRGNAILGFGHLARRFGCVSVEGRALVKEGLSASDPHVRGHSESAEDDIGMFAGQ